MYGHQKWPPKRHVFKTNQALHAQDMMTTLGSVVNMIGGPVRSRSEHEFIKFDNERDIYMSSKNYVANGYGHNLVLQSWKGCASLPIGGLLLVAKSNG
jgi:hypothetical protein